MGRCTCAGTAPGYPQHELDCGHDVPEDATEAAMREWDATLAATPEEG